MQRCRRRGRNGDASLLQPHCNNRWVAEMPDILPDYPRLVKLSHTRVMHRQGNEGPLVIVASRPMSSSGTGVPLKLNNRPPAPSRHSASRQMVGAPRRNFQLFTHQIASLPTSSSSFKAKPRVTRRNSNRCSRYRNTFTSVSMSCPAVRPRSSLHARSDKTSLPLLICPVSSSTGPS